MPSQAIVSWPACSLKMRFEAARKETDAVPTDSAIGAGKPWSKDHCRSDFQTNVGWFIGRIVRALRLKAGSGNDSGGAGVVAVPVEPPRRSSFCQSVGWEVLTCSGFMAQPASTSEVRIVAEQGSPRRISDETADVWHPLKRFSGRGPAAAGTAALRREAAKTFPSPTISIFCPR